MGYYYSPALHGCTQHPKWPLRGNISSTTSTAGVVGVRPFRLHTGLVIQFKVTIRVPGDDPGRNPLITGWTTTTTDQVQNVIIVLRLLGRSPWVGRQHQL